MAKRPNYYKIHTDGHEIELEPIYEELVPVVHGRWEYARNAYGFFSPRCSACRQFNKYHEKYNYCPNCGAKMDGE